MLKKTSMNSLIKNILSPILLLLVLGGWLENYCSMSREQRRLERNLDLLDDSIFYYRNSLEEEVASVGVLQLRCAEFERLRAADHEVIRDLGVRLRRAEAMARQVAKTEVEVAVPLRDTVILYDTVRFFRWHDAWVEVEGELYRDSLHCRVESVDTLLQVVHRVPRKFLFIRWGTKAIRQEILSKNPHTKILYSEYLTLER